MYREPSVEQETFEIKTDSSTYEVTYQMSVTCLQAGNYSSAALDPDEYYGVYHYELLEIVSVEVYDDDTDESRELTDFPDWLVQEVEAEVDSYN